MSIFEQKSDYISTAPLKMATKIPTAAPVITSSSSTAPSPSIQSNVSATSALNNNNSKISGAATSIITVPLMSQSKAPSSSPQVSNVSTTVTPGKPASVGSVASTGSSSSPSVTTAPTSGFSSIPSTTKGKDISTSGSATPGPGGASDIKTTVTASTVTTASPSTGSTAASATAAKPVPVPTPSPTKPTDFKTMNGGTILMKQPPPPVTILPPTPAATPPSVHRQPPSLPQQSAQSGSASVASASNQKPQSAPNPPPSSSNNNTPVKQSSTTPVIQQGKIENQEKPTQPLPLQNQGSSTSTSPTLAQMQSIQPKDQPDLQTASGKNQDQKVISNVTSTVTNSASSVTSAGASNTTTVTTPATVGGTVNNNNNSVQKKVESSSVTQAPSPVITSTVTTNPANKSSTQTSVPSANKMENSEALLKNSKNSSMEVKDQIMLDTSPKANLSGGGDAQILTSGLGPTMKSGTADVNSAKETEKNGNLGENKFGVSTGTGEKKDALPPASKENNGLSKADLILSKENAKDMNRSIYIPTTNEPAIIGKEEKIMNGGQNKEEIGEDVRRIMEAIENAGLCGPKGDTSFDYGPESNIITSSGEGIKGNKASKIARSSLNNQKSRPSTASEVKPRSRPGTAATKSPTKSSPTKPRPATAAVSSKMDHGNENGSPSIGAVKNAKGKTAPASGLSNGSPGATLPPKSATSGPRTSSSRVASAKGNTAPTNATSKTPNQNKNTNGAIENGVDSSSASLVETETGTNVATGSRSTSRLRPSSSLYRPTASSALKGVSSPASHNTTSNHNLHSSPSTPRTPRSSTGARTSRSQITMGDSAGGSGEGKPATLREQFTAFSRFGNKDEDGKHITLSNCDKWMKQAKVIDGKKITTTDTSICFKKLFKTAKKITFEDFKKYVEELAKAKKMESPEILEKLANCGPPGLSSATRAAHSNVVDRLTDTSKYTGSHKERFDATGKGRGMEGRKDVPDGSGYVAAFKEKLEIKEEAAAKKEESTSASPTPAK